MQVSQICLGTMMFGGKTDEPESIRMIDHALERWRQLRGHRRRLRRQRERADRGRGARHATDGAATSSSPPSSTFPRARIVNARGLSRRHLIEACEASLEAAADRLDRSLPAAPLAVPTCPSTRRLRALDDLIRAGKVRYIGCSMFPELADGGVAVGGARSWASTVSSASSPPTTCSTAPPNAR